jgi:hypothetical protein
MADGDCLSPLSSTLSSDQQGYLSSRTAQHTNRGSRRCPWVINVHRGQHIDLYVIDLSLSMRYRSEFVHRTVSDRLDYCHQYALVRDDDIEFSVCAGNSRDSMVYTSKTSSISVELSDQLLEDENINIVLRYVGKTKSGIRHILY